MDKHKIALSVATYCAALSAKIAFKGFDIFDINAAGRSPRVCGYDAVAVLALAQA